MILLSRETKKLIYEAINNLEKVPKLENIQKEIKDLVRKELYYTKTKHNFENRQYKHLQNNTNITNRLVNSYIGKILKEIRIEREKTAFLRKRVLSSRFVFISTVQEYYNMGMFEYIKYANTSRLIPMKESVRRDFTKLVIDDKKITIEEAKDQVLQKYTEELTIDLSYYISRYFK
jgi:hypothetical protein